MIASAERAACALALGFALACGAALSSCRPAARPIPRLSEASGVVLRGDCLFIVDDEWPGGYFVYPIAAPPEFPLESPAILFSLERSRTAWVTWRGGLPVSDLESLDVLADGRLVVLSEDAAALFDETGLVARYDQRLADVFGRGLEGLSVDPGPGGLSAIAALWEGGYPRPRAGEARGDRSDVRPYPPAVVIHELAAFERGMEVVLEGPVGPRSRPARFVPLRAPPLPDEDQGAGMFRAPDLVWRKAPGGEPELIVLLSSDSSDGLLWCRHQWLQRFDLQGRPVGEPLDLASVLPQSRSRKTNWEGLAWFEEGTSLVLVAESPEGSDTPACLVRLPEGW